MAFNESRIHSKQSFESKLSSDTGDNDPLDMIRAALKEVTRIGHDEQGETTHKLQLMLQVCTRAF